MAKQEQKWRFEHKSFQIADTGDYDGHTEVTNGKIIFYIEEEIEDEDLESLINLMNNIKFNIGYTSEGEENYGLFLENKSLKEELTKYTLTSEEINKRAKEIAEQCKPCTKDFYDGIFQGVQITLKANN